MNSDTAKGQSFDGCAYVHRIPTKSVELRHDQHVTFFHFEKQFCKPRSLVRADATGNAFRNNPTLVDGETGRFDLAKLVSCRLIGCADAGVCEGPGHAALSECSKRMSEFYYMSKNTKALFSDILKHTCPKGIGFGQGYLI